MAPTASLDRKACTLCARAKRKCGKELPRCCRCAEKGVECEYPTKRPSSFVILAPENPKAQESGTFDDSASITQVENSAPSSHGLSSDPVTAVAPYSTSYDVALDSRDIWFLAPHTWELQHIHNLDISQFSSSVMKRYPKEIHRSLSQWVKEGTNSFIHRQLYRQRLPRCVQDAYSALTCFLSKTSANEETAYQILQARADQLLEDTMFDTRSATSCNSLDTFDHLARVQSLLVYQALGLFDTDIRLRHLAEERIPLLFKWADEMLESASQVGNLSVFLRQMTVIPENVVNGTITTFKALPQAVGDDALWRAWVLAECTRRTWSVVTGVQTVYLTMQQGWAACPGGTMMTTRKGVWDANTAYEWSKLCSEVDVGFMHREQTERLFSEARPEDVDDFGKAMMEVTYGLERMERWGVDIRTQPLETQATT